MPLDVACCPRRIPAKNGKVQGHVALAPKKVHTVMQLNLTFVGFCSSADMILAGSPRGQKLTAVAAKRTVAFRPYNKRVNCVLGLGIWNAIAYFP